MAVQHKSSQRGISFIGFLFVAIVLGASGVVAAQIFPTVLEFQSIQKAAQRASEGNSPAEIRLMFDKSSAIDDFKSVSGKDLDIWKDGDKVIVAFKYQREIHLAGPAYLTMKYEGQSK